MKEADNIKVIARNRKARHDFQIKDTIEAGIELLGTEVKSIRDGKIQISDAYAFIENGEIFLKNLHISPYGKDSSEGYDPIRVRRLLLHKREIRKLAVQLDLRGMSLIPITIYFIGKVAKIELAVAAGRKKYDKRQAIAKSEARRKISRAMKKDY